MTVPRQKERPVNEILPTTVIGSYPQPEWLVDREMLGGRLPPRVRALEIWRVAPEHLEQAQDDATLLAIRDQELAGLDIVTDREIRRESYSNRFAPALEGMEMRDLFAAGADLVQIILGVLDLGDLEVESVDTVADRIRGALAHVSADRLQVGPDCGMKYLPRDVALGKLRAMVSAADVVRREISESE